MVNLLPVAQRTDAFTFMVEPARTKCTERLAHDVYEYACRLDAACCRRKQPCTCCHSFWGHIILHYYLVGVVVKGLIITYLWAFLVLLRRCCYLQAAQYTPSPACGSLRASPPKVTMIFLIVLLVDCCLPMYPGTPILILYLGYTHNPTYICTRKMSLSLPKC